MCNIFTVTLLWFATAGFAPSLRSPRLWERETDIPASIIRCDITAMTVR